MGYSCKMSDESITRHVSSIELKDLWRRYKRDADGRARERLVVAYSPLVKYVSGRMASGLPAHVEEADLISYGLNGLISAIERFDPEREIKFETYAITRIKDAIIDELRSLDWVPRSVRARARAIERANAKLEHELRRAPTDEEMAAELEMTVAEFQETLLQISNSTVAALDELWTVSDASGDQVSLLDTLQDAGPEDPAAVMEATDLKDRIADAIARLPEREKLVVALYYYENLTLREIAGVLGVTESRVSQLHTRAVLRLRGGMADREAPEDVENVAERVLPSDADELFALELTQAREREESDVPTIERARRISAAERTGPEQFVAAAQDRRNVEARAAFVTRYHPLVDEEINARARDHVAGGAPDAEQWRKKGDIVAVMSHEGWLYPSFQFADGLPKPAVRLAVHEFRSHGASDWELALWFTSPNAWLRATPADLLDERPDDVTRAARRAFEAPV